MLLLYCVRSPFTFDFLIDNSPEAILDRSGQMSRRVRRATLHLLTYLFCIRIILP